MGRRGGGRVVGNELAERAATASGVGEALYAKFDERAASRRRSRRAAARSLSVRSSRQGRGAARVRRACSDASGGVGEGPPAR